MFVRLLLTRSIPSSFIPTFTVTAARLTSDINPSSCRQGHPGREGTPGEKGLPVSLLYACCVAMVTGSSMDSSDKIRHEPGGRFSLKLRAKLSRHRLLAVASCSRVTLSPESQQEN